MRRRDFIKGIALTSAAAGSGCVTTSASRPQRLFFTSDGKTCFIREDGSGLETLEFNVPKQVTWQPGPFLSDGKRVIFLSMEERRDGPGRPFDQFYTLTPTHLWLYDFDRKSLTEIATQDRREVFYTPQCLISDTRMLVQVPRSKLGQTLSMNLDGSDARAFTGPGEGLPYGFSVSPDQQRIAFHLASPQGYQIWTSDTEGAGRKLIAAHPERLYFGPAWSPNGEWLLFQSCNYTQDPAHEASDICIARPDGSELRFLTENQSHWFGATYGNPTHRGSGSNMPVWTRDNQILFARRLPNSRPAWEYQANRPDTDHFNRDWKPDQAKGGTEICLLNPVTKKIHALTQNDPPLWDFRPTQSPNAQRIAFLRCPIGEPPALWIMNSDGARPRVLTDGFNHSGADHPRWLPESW